MAKKRKAKTPQIVPVELLTSMGSEHHNWIPGEIFPASADEARSMIAAGIARVPRVETEEDPTAAFVRIAHAEGVTAVMVPAGTFRDALTDAGIEVPPEDQGDPADGESGEASAKSGSQEAGE